MDTKTCLRNLLIQKGWIAENFTPGVHYEETEEGISPLPGEVYFGVIHKATPIRWSIRLEQEYADRNLFHTFMEIERQDPSYVLELGFCESGMERFLRCLADLEKIAFSMAD